MITDNKFIQLQGPLFEAVQLQRIFADSKIFVDSIPNVSPQTIMQQYKQYKNKDNFNLENFIREYFTLPISAAAPSKSTAQHTTMEQHIQQLWSKLIRSPDKSIKYSTLIPLPYNYIVPGGRFRENYYWDTYFTSLGITYNQYSSLLTDIIKNFSYLIDQFGHIPNANRVYYLSRSQPPFFNCLLDALEQISGIESILPYVNQLEKEYQFWMDGKDLLNNTYTSHRRVVYLPDGEILNRYWDDENQARPEAFYDDITLHQQAKPNQQAELFRNIRAACESGWDFSSRWLRESDNLASIYTSELIPIDLNCLLYFSEQKLAAYYAHHSSAKANKYKKLASLRKTAINKYCWDKQQQFYFDYCWTQQSISATKSLAALYPLFFKCAESSQANPIAETVKSQFLMTGGLTTTLHQSSQQWDKPNGWAPLHWIAIQGLRHYQHHSLADEIQDRWIKLNREVFNRSGKMVEKYNVCTTDLAAAGGEYPLQDGFGWSNGVVSALLTD